jgi:hypothetical protein
VIKCFVKPFKEVVMKRNFIYIVLLLGVIAGFGVMLFSVSADLFSFVLTGHGFEVYSVSDRMMAAAIGLLTGSGCLMCGSMCGFWSNGSSGPPMVEKE